MLLHALLGCCAHHAHACHHAQPDRSKVNSQDGTHQHCLHHTKGNNSHHETLEQIDESNSPAHSHDDSEPCDESECSYVSVVQTDEFKSVIALTLTGYFDLTPVNVPVVWPSLVEYSLCSLNQPDALRLRTHLQVWSL